MISRVNLMLAQRRAVWARIAVVCVMAVLTTCALIAQNGKAAQWRVATEEELKAVIPARAPVESEKIETEFSTASAITNGRGKYIAGVVMITAGYSAEGKYSHYFIAQVPIKVGTLSLDTGAYVFGWTRDQESLTVSFYEAHTGKLVGTVKALRDPSIKRVESFRIWPPGDKSAIQLGRFTFPYLIAD